MDDNQRAIIALRELADRLEHGGVTRRWASADINHALSTIDGADDAERLLTILLDGAGINAR